MGAPTLSAAVSFTSRTWLEAREYMGHNKEMEEEEMENIFGRNCFAALYVCGSYSIISLPIDILKSSKLKSGLPRPAPSLLSLS